MQVTEVLTKGFLVHNKSDVSLSVSSAPCGHYILIILDAIGVGIHHIEDPMLLPFDWSKFDFVSGDLSLTTTPLDDELQNTGHNELS